MHASSAIRILYAIPSKEMFTDINEYPRQVQSCVMNKVLQTVNLFYTQEQNLKK